MSKKPEIKRLLVAIDHSGYKNKIVSTAFELAKGLGAEIFALHIVDKASLGAAGALLGYYRGGKIEAYEEEMKIQAQKLLDEVRNAGATAGINVSTTVIINQSVSSAIVEYAEQNHIDLILVGTKGMSGIEKFLMGSVASNVIGHAHCSVLAVR
jgi:nucleotide-binding universal stress UspA family protein